MKGFHYCEFCGNTQASFAHDFEECDECVKESGECDLDCEVCND